MFEHETVCISKTLKFLRNYQVCQVSGYFYRSDDYKLTEDEKVKVIMINNENGFDNNRMMKLRRLDQIEDSYIRFITALMNVI